MKSNFKIIFTFALLLLVVASCGEQEENIAEKTSELGFSSLINDFFEGGRLTDELPSCSDNAPFEVCVKIKRSNGTYILDKTPLFDGDGLGDGDDNIIEIEIAPASINDLDNDGDIDTWFTEESTSLILQEGDYTIDFFVVKDADGNPILAAPHEDADFENIEYQNFVSDALPIEVELFAGTKKYVEVEVLCFDTHYAIEFGYQFIDIVEIEQQHLCLFGNVCESFGQHLPAYFEAKVWEYDANAADFKGNLLFSGENEYGTNANNEAYALPLCIPLPDREDVEERFYGEVCLLNNGIPELIRYGVFNENQIKSLYVNEDTSYYWHFRQNCEICDDTQILEGCVPTVGNNCNDSLRTQTQGGWGANPNGNNPGVYLHANFSAAFPSGMQIGCANGYNLALTSAQDVTNLLPEGGAPAALTQNYIDPTNTGTVLAGQVIALTLSVGFDNYDANFAASDNALKDMTINNGEFDGWTVQDILDEANLIIGGCPSNYLPQEINAIVTIINENYVDGESNNGFLTCIP